MAAQRSLAVPEGLDGMRLDAAVARIFGLSRNAAADLIEAGDALLGGAPASKSARVTTGIQLDVTLPEPPQGSVGGPPPALVDGLTIVYEDTDIIVVDKPVGVAAHPSPGWEGPTVSGGLAATGRRISTSGAAERQGIVHRLDVGTSGLMVVAKSEVAYSRLKDAFRDRTVDKRYRALVQGHPDPSRGTIDAPIGRHPGADYKFAVIAGGRDSVTHYETEEAFRAASLLDIRLETGRTHQIRVHMAAIKHPCVGDIAYGADPTLAARLGVKRQWLHAARLSFDHPTEGRPVSFESPIPEDLAGALRLLEEMS